MSELLTPACKFLSPVLWFLFFSLANTYSDGLGNLDFERSQLGSGMSQRSAAKRLVNALHQHAQRTGQKQFDVQTLRSIADRVNVKVKALKYKIINNKSQVNTVSDLQYKGKDTNINSVLSPFGSNYFGFHHDTKTLLKENRKKVSTCLSSL